MQPSPPVAPTPQELANRVAEQLNADVIFCNGELDRDLDGDFISLCCASRRRRENVLLLLVTRGGDADVAFRMARCLQKRYKRFSLCVSGYCKSAGTLVALGAQELVFSEHGELGPLDVQMSKKDELWERQSGLTVNASLMALAQKAFLAFEHFFLEMESGSQGAIKIKTAGEIATALTNGLFAPLFSQIDPLHVGEAARAMSIADHYGKRLLKRGKNCTFESLNLLISEYPSHGFVIDMDEAKGLFKNVREPSEAEAQLAEALAPASRVASTSTGRAVFLSDEVAAPAAVAVAPGGVTDDKSKQGGGTEAGRAPAPAGEQPQTPGADSTPAEHAVAAGAGDGKSRRGELATR